MLPARANATLIAGIFLLRISAQAQTAFAPLEDWKAAVIGGDQSALTKLYDANPALTEVGKDGGITLRDECAFWSEMAIGGMTEFNPRLLESATGDGKTRLVLRISVTLRGKPLYASMSQVWAHQAGGWKLIASRRAVFADEATRRLPQPVAPNVNLYSDPREAQAELNAALDRAARERKRVLVVFGGNWCYDCHVLDTTFRSKEFAQFVNANFVVVHINVGDDGKDNNELAARLGVALDKGVPSLGVLEPDGKAVYAQKNGEFESTLKIGPEDVRAFLEKWKPAR